MAEAFYENAERKFYCHQCTQEITPKIPDYTCPQCEKGFVEELPLPASSGQDRSSGSLPAESSAQDSNRLPVPAQMVNRMMMMANLASHEAGGSLRRRMRQRTVPRLQVQRRGRIETLSTGDGRGGPSSHPYVQVMQTRRRRPLLMPSTPQFEARIQQLSGNNIEVLDVPMSGDPAQGSSRLEPDNLMTFFSQMLSQLDGGGAPPAQRESIEAIPTVPISQEQVDKTLQCAVCMDEFTLGENVRKLPCDHCYHSNCIVPWLRMHGTCPVCRKNLSGEDAPEESYDDSPAFIVHMRFQTNSPSQDDPRT